MLRRPLDANRMEFFAHAETFAALVQLDFVLVPGNDFAILLDRLISMFLFSKKYRKDLAATRYMSPQSSCASHTFTCAGAVQTITQLLKREESSVAAITMLGKTIELCCEKVTSHCLSNYLANLSASPRELKLISRDLSLIPI